MKAPTFKKTAMNYIKSYFVIDLVSTIVSNFLFLLPGYGAGLWAYRLKLFRIARVSYIRYAYTGIVSRATEHFPKIGKLLNFLITLLIESFFWLHILTCFWIKLGCLDAYQERWKNMDPNQVSWMFIPG